MATTKEIYLAGGCYWGTEHFLQCIRGVISTEVGFANGNTSGPVTYKEVCTGTTGHAETVHVTYDPTVIGLDCLLRFFMRTIDPTSVNKQGNDVGTQYRTGIYFVNAPDERVARAVLKDVAATVGDTPIAVEVCPLRNFCRAEDSHQKYLDANPTGYCHIDPKLFEFAKKAYVKPDNATLRRKIKPVSFNVTQNGATEPPYRNAYDHETRPGLYVDVTTGEPLFSSSDKFDCGCGWPSFRKAIDEQHIIRLEDKSHGMERTEVRSACGYAHLGHVFNESYGTRFCINSASLTFIPLEDMAKKGYEEFIPLVEKK